MKLNIEDIKFAPWNTRAEITEENIRSLAASMDADNLIQPISVIKDPDGEGFICYDGNRRLAAARYLGWKTIDANVDDHITEEQAKVRTVTCNLQREEDSPLLAAGLIGELLDKGIQPEVIADGLGQTISWVNRRRKLLTLSDGMKSVAGKVTMQALEQIAALPEKVQEKLVKSVEGIAKYSPKVTAKELHWEIENATRDLDSVAFDTTECAKCLNRTGAEGDLFAVADGKLGRCLVCDCFAKKVKEDEEKKIKAATAGASEVVRVQYAWQIPDEAKAKKPNKKNPCAYIYFSDGEVVCKFGESKAAYEAKRKAEEAKRDALRAAEREDAKRADEIEQKFDAFVNGDGEEYTRNDIRCYLNADAPDWYVDVIYDYIRGYHGRNEWMKIFTIFGNICTKVGITDGDIDWYGENFTD